MTSPYLLDTNVCIEIARGRLSGIQNHMAALSYGQVTICAIVWAELELGARLSPKGYARARTQIEVFSLLPQWPFDRPCAERYAALRADLQRRGQLIGGNDIANRCQRTGAWFDPGHPQHPRIQPRTGITIGRLADMNPPGWDSLNPQTPA